MSGQLPLRMIPGDAIFRDPRARWSSVGVLLVPYLFPL